jgi:hypothetical protein
LNLVMQMDAGNVAELPEKYKAYVMGRPAWATLAFAVSVVSGVIGAVLYLLRNTTAAPAFWVSCAGAAVVVFSAFGSGAMAVLVTSGMSVLVAAMFAIAARRLIGS